MIGQPAGQFKKAIFQIRQYPEQFFHQWRCFYFGKNTDTVDSYVTKVSQFAAMLNYEELQILELLKNTLPNRLYPILFPVDNL